MSKGEIWIVKVNVQKKTYFGNTKSDWLTSTSHYSCVLTKNRHFFSWTPVIMKSLPTTRPTPNDLCAPVLIAVLPLLVAIGILWPRQKLQPFKSNKFQWPFLSDLLCIKLSFGSPKHVTKSCWTSLITYLIQTKMEQGHYYLFLMQTHEVEKKKVFAKLDFFSCLSLHSQAAVLFSAVHCCVSWLFPRSNHHRFNKEAFLYSRLDWQDVIGCDKTVVPFPSNNTK